jgi:hypothetical protein
MLETANLQRIPLPRLADTPPPRYHTAKTPTRRAGSMTSLADRGVQRSIRPTAKTKLCCAS